MKWNVTRSVTHFEYAEVEADSYEEAIKLAQQLDDEEWEEDANAELTEQWIYEAEEIEDDDSKED